MEIKKEIKKRKQTSYILNLLFVLIALYFAQGSVYKEGTLVSQGSLLVLIVISLIYFIKSLMLKVDKSLFFKSWSALFLLNLIGYLFSSDYFNPIYFNLMKSVSISLLIFYPFYYYAHTGVLRTKQLKWFLILMTPILILKWNFEQNFLISEGYTTLVNNSTYLFVFFIPYVFLFPKQNVQSIVGTLLLLLLFYFIIIGSKRGAFINGCIGVLFYIYYQFQSIQKKHLLKGFVFASIGMLLLSFFSYKFFLGNETLISRLISIQEGSGSGREYIFFNILNKWYKSDNIIHLLFGYGFGSSVFMSGTGNYAHNDWLELLSNFGMLGVIIYLILFYSAFRIIKKEKWELDKKTLLLTIMCIWFVTTLFSMHYNSIDSSIHSVLLGYLFGSKSKTLI